MLWDLAKPIQARASKPDASDNGTSHCLYVELYVWRLVNETQQLAGFSPAELFLLSCSACCHDLDRGLKTCVAEGTHHGEGSGGFVVKHHRELGIPRPDAIAVDLIVGVHDKKGTEYSDVLAGLSETYSLPSGPVDLQRLAVLLKAADILHMDNTRITEAGTDPGNLKGSERDKWLFRHCVSGWRRDGSRIVIAACPESQEQRKALLKGESFVKDREWPSVADALRRYGFPYRLEFEHDDHLLPGKPADATPPESLPIEKKQETVRLPTTGQFHAVLKGEVAVFLNGKKLDYDEQSRPELQVRTQEVCLHEGDVVVLQIASRFVHRCLRLGFVSDDSRLVLPVRIQHLRRVDEVPLQDIDAQAIKASHTRATEARPDPKCEATWGDLNLPLEESDWFWGPDKNKTYRLALIVESSKFKVVAPEERTCRDSTTRLRINAESGTAIPTSTATSQARIPPGVTDDESEKIRVLQEKLGNDRVNELVAQMSTGAGAAGNAAEVVLKIDEVFDLNRYRRGPGAPPQTPRALPDSDSRLARRLLTDLKGSMAGGELVDSLIAPIVLAVLSGETGLKLASGYNPSWISTGIRLSDEYFVLVRESAGERDWQRDFAQTVTPTLVGAVRSLDRSADAQAMAMRLCEAIAAQLRLRLIWPDEPDQFNDLANGIYRACLQATELESDAVLAQLKGLTVRGPE
jgi:hypothetical protein